MYVELKNKIQFFFKNLIRKIIAELRKNKFLALGILLFFLILLSVPQIIFLSYFNRSVISTGLNKIALDSKLAISWDGISASPYRGIVIYNVRISFNSEELRLKPLALIPEIRILPDYLRTLGSHKFEVRSIRIISAKWKYWVNSKELNHNFNQEVAKLLKNSPDFHINLSNNEVSLIFEKKNYEREVWNIALNSGFLKSHDNIITTHFEYDDVAWGKGNINFIPYLCDQCNLNNGVYQIAFANLPVNRLSWFFKNYQLKNGFINAKISGDYKEISNEKSLSTKVVLSVDRLNINDDSNHSILTNEQISLVLNFSNIQSIIKSDFTGDWNNSRFFGDFTKKKKSIWPEECNFQLDNNAHHNFPLVYGYWIKGLKNIHFNLKEDPEKHAYRLISGDLNIDSGKLVNSAREEILRIPMLKLNLLNNDLSADIKLAKGSSDLEYKFTASIVPLMKRIYTLIEYEDYKKNKPLDYETVVFQIDEKGKINSNNFSWPDIQPFYESLNSKWNKSINSDQYKGWRPSVLRDRAWFQKFLMRTTLENEINISHWTPEIKSDSDKDSGKPVAGLLRYMNSFLEFDLKSEPESYLLKIDTSSSYPIIRGEYAFQFNKLNSFSEVWLPPEFLTSLESSEIAYKFSTSGERPVDLQANYLGDGTLALHKSNLTDKTGITDSWDVINVNFKKYGSKILLNLTGENSTSTLSSWGTFNENDDAMWNLKSSTYTKRSSLNF